LVSINELRRLEFMLRSCGLWRRLEFR